VQIVNNGRLVGHFLEEQSIDMNTYSLSASYFGPTARTAILLHGGGNSSSLQIHPLRENLADRGIGTLAIDHLGHGKTGGDVGQSSLQGRLNEVVSALEYFQPSNLLGSVSMSMGGHISLKLQKLYQFESVVLIAPAVYCSDAYQLRFSSGFSEIIRKPESWRNSDVWEILRLFSGRLLTIFGKDDTVIPTGVKEAIQLNANNADHTYVELEDVDHFVMTRLREGDQARRDKILNLIAETLSSDKH
jgi:pimeloyl-ACP methyl ester carboxylesterase